MTSLVLDSHVRCLSLVVPGGPMLCVSGMKRRPQGKTKDLVDETPGTELEAP